MSRNQLDQETSPYLLQHKDNPVHWYPWGREALEEAAASNRPILLSIGYTACHWCHVMNRESFADGDVAARMNELFVNVMVDREERPDLDMLYQAAANGLGHSGGWPLTMVLTPAGDAFFAGTYFPNEARIGLQPFRNIIEDIGRVWREQPEQVAATATRLRQHLTNLWGREMRGPLDAALLDHAAIRIAQRFDIFYGGLIGQMKFPAVPLVEVLWRTFLRTGAPQFMQLASVSLDNMLLGGIYDHVGGGFARYSSDERWLVPHFEKIAGDNAQLVDLMTSVWQYNRNALCQQRVQETIDWLLREMRVEDGFASNLDSDTEGEEGKYYLWTEPEVDAALMGTFAQRFKAAYNISRDGNFNGRNILHRLNSPVPFPQSDADEGLFAKQRALLLAARQARVQPARDNKVLADANGIIITALANAGAAFQKAEWTNAAIRAFDFVLRALDDGGKLHHSWCGGKRGHTGFAEDYAHMSRAALMLWEVTGEKRYLDQAKIWVRTLDELFWDASSGGYFSTSSEDAPLPIRARIVFDQAQPCANGTMIGVLAKLYKATADQAYLERANILVQALAGEASRSYISMGSYFNGLEYLGSGLQIVVIGPNNNPKTHELAAAVMGRSLPNRLLTVMAPDDEFPIGHPAHGKAMQNGQPTAYLCQRQTISAPIVNPVTLSQVLQLPQRPQPGAQPQ